MSMQPSTIYLADYRPPNFSVSHVELDFDIHPTQTRVVSTMTMKRHPQGEAIIVLNGFELTLIAIELNGRELLAGEYHRDEESLSIPCDEFDVTVRVITEINPLDNKALEGLYRSASMFCTQCEAEGFRRISYFPDRPDVLATYRVRIEADKAECPVLLSNGNLELSGELDNQRHFSVWYDPFPKPSYLFALVAGDLSAQSDVFVTASGREVALHLYVEAKDLDKCDFALEALKRSMIWDEEKYGREYDLDLFNIVAVDDFNMGAMENKSLNIFNSSCVLAKPETTTDQAFQRIEGIVAHEYFHNWSGNRVTCRDWFQLSLKEGFTVYRDAQFSADMGSAAVKRIEDVALLRARQFAEDAGPLAHPVRPASYIEISNFYTLTVYEKGAEVVRMINTLIGDDAFRKGSDLYFDRNDGTAATIEDFIAAMAEASGRDFSAFMSWYSQAGTPEVHVTERWDETSGFYELAFEQRLPLAGGRENWKPLVIPIRLSLLGEAGALAIQQAGAESADNTEWVYELDQYEATVKFGPFNERPVPSLLRDFSAPVKLVDTLTDEQLRFLIARDTDAYVRWDSSQKLLLAEIERAKSDSYSLCPKLSEALAAVLADDAADPALRAYSLSLPSEALLQQGESVDPVALFTAKDRVKAAIATELQEQFRTIVAQRVSWDQYQPSAEQVGQRLLQNLALDYVVKLGECSAAEAQFASANNMTDQLAALRSLFRYADRHPMAEFISQWAEDGLVLNTAFALQASARDGATLADIQRITEHQAFDFDNPNKVRAVFGSFGSDNTPLFHAKDGSGYEYLGDMVLKIDESNPQTASRLAAPLTRWRNLAPAYSAAMKAVLERLAGCPTLSKDLYEVVSKSLL
ncbi:alanyl aminopeptidase [Umboniibacter marinipuniceus]|uniref:Aminopeptidase N n=2 Tax=Umboniibacter marinipuniceus TaxID=569599 RepID=A0A3M0A7T5_9GAMM|nr:alanyl aminopeptidase [Umboniibacter marinipuniceus]